ncbi:hypothetical protein [Roseobacter litoralis]|uniref:hypothetical protein n=1 Tax=Roseobacter litoralis TaxID=42443 RepID=UPI00248F4ACC|nr:hypothetical protein [Roseobacter litoralis]
MSSLVPELLDRHRMLTLADANEAETRLKLIDRIIFEVLGWGHDDASVEERVSEDGNTTFSDYVLRTGFSSLVIEAKRSGRSDLVVADKRKALLNRKLVSGDTGDAIIQARDYGRKLAIPFAVVTNGDQWVIFPATRTDEVPFEKSSAIVFPDIQSVLERDFSDFYDLLSREAVIGGSLETELLGRIEDQTDGRRLNQYFTTGFSKLSRNSIFHLIENEISTAFSEDIISSDPDLFAKAYVETPERLRYDKRIGMHLSKRQNVAPKAPHKAMSPQGRRAISGAIERAADSVRPLALLVLGQVGAGKTTFITHIKTVRERDRFEPRADRPYPHWIYVDCRKLGQTESPSDFIASVMFEHLTNDEFLSSYERCVKFAYKKEIEAMQRGPLSLLAFDENEQKRQIAEFLTEDYEAKKPYLERVFTYAAKNSAVFLVIDNVDQFDDPKRQEIIFGDAIAVAQRLGLCLVLAMRDATYVENRAKPIFDAFDFDPVQVEAPDVKAVLARRFAVAKELLRDKPSEFTAENGARMHLDDTSMLIDLISSSVLDSTVGSAISVLSTGDIRLCLRMTREFLRNGYTATGRAVDIFQRTGKYRLPAHEAMRAIMLGSQPVYSEEFSPVANPFDAKLDLSKTQMLRLFVLSAIVRKCSSRKVSSISGEEIRSALLEMGYSPDITLKILQGMCAARYIFTTAHGKPSFEANYLPSRLGGHALRVLMTEFVFLENVIMDTFIDDDDTWSDLKAITSEIYSERAPTKRIIKRIERVERFYEYLTQLYSGLREEASRRGLSAEWQADPFKEGKSVLASNIEKVRRSVSRNYDSTGKPRGIRK